VDERLVDRPLYDVDVLDPDEGDDGVGVEQPAADDSEQPAVKRVAEAAVDPGRGVDDGRQRDEGDQQRHNRTHRRVDEHEPVEDQSADRDWKPEQQ